MAKQTKRAKTLTARQTKFAQQYVIHLNATQAALVAGYSAKSAHVTGSQLIRLPKVGAYIAKLQEKEAKKAEVKAENVVRELALLGFANMADYMGADKNGDPYLDFSKLTREQSAALQEVTVEDYTEGRGENARDVRRIKFRLYDKRAALVDLAKHLGLFEADNRQKNQSVVALMCLWEKIKGNGARKEVESIEAE